MSEIKHPGHYQFYKACREVRDVINDRNKALLNSKFSNYRLIYNYNNSIKYLLRWFAKGGLKDLYKARETLDRLILTVEDMQNKRDQLPKRESIKSLPLPVDSKSIPGNQYLK